MIRGQQWRDVIQMQSGWIGQNDGFSVEFDLKFHSTDEALHGERIAVFTKQPGIVAAGAINFIAIGPKNALWSERFRLVGLLHCTKLTHGFTYKIILSGLFGI